ncbi:hypothetical protein [Clostridium lacusfryxellense]|uniref:hypothetical protein n=1 Tax=Clostridium lacusfryxellense TaxID=205328 RepID=UPI001C0D8A91|nr:hypothetical protein [Clostridium lacusfryxellense]MBU3111604.1 hypothetical protein [Clostridium lacusfryxellense]
MANKVTFKRVKSIVFGKQDEDFFNELNKSGYFDKNWSNKIKQLIKSDFYGRKEDLVIFTKDQENVIVDIIKKYIKDIKLPLNDNAIDEVVCDKENIDKSKEALQALSNLQRFRKK